MRISHVAIATGFVLRLLLEPASVSAQIQQAWVAHYNNGVTNGQHQALKLLLDSSGNIYATGFSQNTNGGTGYATLKYAPNGQQAWVSRFDSTNFPDSQPTSFVLDSQTNVVVTGTAVTVKYDDRGNPSWTLPYNAASIATDPSNNVCITGVNTSFLTMKFSPAGINLWSQSYATTYSPSVSQVISDDAQGYIYVGGYGFFAPPAFIDRTETVIIKYSPSGNQEWATSSDTGDNGAVQFEGLIQDAAGNSYAAFNVNGGYHAFPYGTGAYSPSGVSLWQNYNPTANVFSGCYGFVVDHHQNIVLAGENAYYYPSTGYGTYKINASGQYLWTNLCPVIPTNVNVGTSVAVDLQDTVYVTGFSAVANGTNDIVTIAYDTNGKQLWLQRYSGLGLGAVGNAIAADNNGNVYVAGYENVPGGGSEMVLIKYSPVTIQHQSSGSFLLQAQGAPNEPFDIQATTNLQTWLDLGPHDADTNGLLQYLDTNMFSQRFYLAIPK